MITTKQLNKIFGNPNKTGKGYLVIVNIPYPMRLAWDTSVVVNRISCHKDVADNILGVLNDLLKHYGYDEIKRLGIDLYGGMFMFRPKRNLEKKYIKAIESGDLELAASYLSNHSWGTAIDLDPARNLLRETSRTARFARSEYKLMIDIFYKHGFESLGVEKNYDWMHFQIKA
jgi:hypothetical protein